MLEPQLEVVVGSVGWLQFVSSRGQRNRKKEIRFRDLSSPLSFFFPYLVMRENLGGYRVEKEEHTQ